MAYSISPWHGEAGTIFYVVGEQSPDPVGEFPTRATAEEYITQLFVCPECGTELGEYYSDGGEPDCLKCMGDMDRLRALEVDGEIEEAERNDWREEIAREEGMLNGIESYNDWRM